MLLILALCPVVSSAQDLGRGGSVVPSIRQEPSLPTAQTNTDDRYLQLGEELLLLDGRLASLERLVVQLISRQDDDQRDGTYLTAEFSRFRSDVEQRLAELEFRPIAVAEPLPEVDMVLSGDSASEPEIDRFGQAMAFANAEDWASAELAFDTFIANNREDERLAQARYHLGLAYLGQQQPAQAARIFLALFESGEAEPFGADNLFALAQSLRELGGDDDDKICSVYTEISSAYEDRLTALQRDRLLDERLVSNCTL